VVIKKPNIHHHLATKGELAAIVAQRYAYRFYEPLFGIKARYLNAVNPLI